MSFLSAMPLGSSSLTFAINAETEGREDPLESNGEDEKDNIDTNEEVEGKNEGEDLLEIAGARGRWTQWMFFLCASS